MNTSIDKLFDVVAVKGHVCVGLDTCVDYVPAAERQNKTSAEAVLAFNKALVDVTFDVCACYKVQIAYYEEMGIDGLRTYSETLKYIRQKGSLVIADIKRGDITDTAARYAKAHFYGDFEADFVTINPYMGMDSIAPWLKEAVVLGKGAFVLMRTSNPGMRDFQQLAANNGKKLYDIVGDKLSGLAAEHHGKCGYGLLGAVVGCTERDEAAQIRKNHPDLFFLIPGYGAQGGGALDVTLLLRNGNGGVVNASRSIITAWKTPVNHGQKPVNNSFAAEAAREAVVKMRDEILGAL
ncbi:MAG: orotidine-5'-phosphate decarboxylase [Treponema sp.]|jgi:orotidine-5'-phosphate decarboxylase|nr:orotidine-5'-phosphate decarboxylase [Treponema sp.]